MLSLGAIRLFKAATLFGAPIRPTGLAGGGIRSSRAIISSPSFCPPHVKIVLSAHGRGRSVGGSDLKALGRVAGLVHFVGIISGH